MILMPKNGDGPRERLMFDKRESVAAAAVRLARGLRAAGSVEYAMPIEERIGELPSGPPGPSQERAIQRLKSAMAVVANHPPSHLSSEQDAELEDLHFRAVEAAEHRLRVIRKREEHTSRIEPVIPKRLREIITGESSGKAGANDHGGAGGAAKPDGPSDGCWVWWKGIRYDVPKGRIHKLIFHL